MKDIAAELPPLVVGGGLVPVNTTEESLRSVSS
jgi:hypothetical protein